MAKESGSSKNLYGSDISYIYPSALGYLSIVSPLRAKSNGYLIF